MSEQRTVVIPDLHGHAELLKTAVSTYGDSVDRYLIIGDAIDRGPDSKGVLDTCKKIGATLLWGNHEWVVMGALTDHNPQRREEWLHEVWYMPSGRKYENNMLSSYGISDRWTAEESAQRLYERMYDLGHLAIIQNASIYIEEDDYIAVHAGLTSEPWEKQKEELDEQAALINARQFEGEPIQLFSHRLGIEPKTEATEKILITGHSCLDDSDTIEDRITDDGKRVRLASRIWDGQPLYVWQSWNHQVREFTKN